LEKLHFARKSGRFALGSNQRNDLVAALDESLA
jgi:hypothetical protein